jgi:dihydrodipicolinate synthase/N-acetylneuraminate lyase
MPHKFAGIYTPIVTPFTADGEVDERAIVSNVDRYLASPLTGLVVLGSNGEAAQLEDDEADRVIDTVRRRVPKDRPMLVGTGRESTRATIAASKRAAALGADAVMARTPSFYKPQMTSENFIRHYTEVADASPVPVLLYNVTMYTGVNLLPDAVAKLSEHPNIVGLKDSGNDMLQIGDYLTRSTPDFTVLAGAAPTLFTAAVRARQSWSRGRCPCAAASPVTARAIDRTDLRRPRPQGRPRPGGPQRRRTACAASSGDGVGQGDAPRAAGRAGPDQGDACYRTLSGCCSVPDRASSPRA